MLRKIIILALTLGVCLTVTGALVGVFYPLGLTLVEDDAGRTFVGLRAEDGMAMVFAHYRTDHPEAAERHRVRTFGTFLTSDRQGLAFVVRTLEPVSWIKARVENRCGVPSVVESYEYDPSERPGTFHGMRRVDIVGLHFGSLMALAILTTVLALRGPWRLRQRHRHGLCLTCGYDLRGNESGLCSECGSPIALGL